MPYVPLFSSAIEHEPRAARLGGGLVVLASAFAFALLIAPAARATPLPPSLSPLPGSSFQGADGNQDDALPAIDWQALQAAERVHHSPDPNGQDSAFTGGTRGGQARPLGLDHRGGRRQPGASPTSSMRGRRSIHREATRSSTWGSRERQPHCWRTYSTSRRDDVHHVRAQPRPAAVGQRTGHDSMPEHRRRARLVRGAGQRCQRRDPTLGHDTDRSGERVCHRGTTSRTPRASRRMSTLRAPSTRPRFVRTCRASMSARSPTSASARRR